MKFSPQVNCLTKEKKDLQKQLDVLQRQLDEMKRASRDFFQRNNFKTIIRLLAMDTNLPRD